MSSQSRKARGMRTQLVVAQYFQAHGWPHAESAGSGRPGRDVLGVAGLSVEVKARRDLRIPQWLRQAAGYEGLPVLIHRPDGMGEASVDDWPFTVRFADGIKLLLEAGYQ